MARFRVTEVTVEEEDSEVIMDRSGREGQILNVTRKMEEWKSIHRSARVTETNDASKKT